jgi:hypothetical protein
MATHPADDTDDKCAVCGKLIKKGEGRFLVKDDAAHIDCYEGWQRRQSRRPG